MAAWPHPCARIEIDAKPKLGNAPRRLRPMARFRAAFRAGESTDVVLIGKARHGVVGLRLEHPADEPPLGMDTEDGQGVAPAAERGLAALVRCSTSAVMKIVLPARERPVTPRRTCGPIVSRTRLSAAARASKRRSERRGKPKSSYWRRELERSGGFHEKRLGKANEPARVGVIGQFHHLLL